MNHCPRPSSFHLTVEMTGEVLSLCDYCARMYETGVEITYAPRRPG